MASNTFTRHTVSGNEQHTRKDTQGRKPLSPEMVKSGRTVYMTDADFEQAEQKAAALGWSFSKYADIAIALFDISKLSTLDNC